jgi:hypothetical protein
VFSFGVAIEKGTAFSRVIEQLRTVCLPRLQARIDYIGIDYLTRLVKAGPHDFNLERTTTLKITTPFLRRALDTCDSLAWAAKVDLQVSATSASLLASMTTIAKVYSLDVEFMAKISPDSAEKIKKYKVDFGTAFTTVTEQLLSTTSELTQLNDKYKFPNLQPHNIFSSQIQVCLFVFALVRVARFLIWFGSMLGLSWLLPKIGR